MSHPLDQPFTDTEIAAGIYHVAGRVPTGEALSDTLGIHHPYPHDAGQLRRKVAHFFGFDDAKELPWARSGSKSLGLEGTLRLRGDDMAGGEAMFSGRKGTIVKHIMLGRIRDAAEKSLSPLELQIAITVFQLSKSLDNMIIREDDGTVRTVSQRERHRIQDLMGHLFDLPGV